MTKRSKRGVSRTFVSYVLITAVLLLLIIIFIKVLPYFQKTSDIELCRSTVLAQSVLKETIMMDSIVEPDCPTRQVVFFDNHVEINTRKQEVYDIRKKTFAKSFDGLSNDIVNQVVAEELRQCWYQFLAGQKSLFNMDWTDIGELYPELTCYICAEVSFDESVTQKKYTGFLNYIKEKKMPGTRESYYKYIAENQRLCNPMLEVYTPDLTWKEWFTSAISNIPLGSLITFTPFDKTMRAYAEKARGEFDNKLCWKRLVTGALVEVNQSVDSHPFVNITFNASYDKKYAVVFMRYGTNAKIREASSKIIGDWMSKQSLESYAAYVFDWDQMMASGTCDSVKRGRVK